MKKLIVISMFLTVAAGCNTTSVPEAKKEAYKRWHQTRARVMTSLAQEQYNTGNLKKAKSKVAEAIALDQENKIARLLLSKIYIEQAAYPLAVAELSKLHEEHPKSAEVLYLLGVAQEKSGLLDDALVSYRRSQSLDDSSLSAVIAAGEVLASQGKIRQAQLYIDSYIPMAGNEPGMYELAGRLAMIRGEYDKAVGHYQLAHDLDYKNLRYAESLGRAQFLAGRHAQAIESIKALTTVDDYEMPKWAFTILGDSYMALGLTGRARQAYFRATETAPTDFAVWSNLAKAALALEDLPRAIVAARQALKLDGGALEAVMLLGYAMLRDGQVNQSLILLTHAVRQHPKSAELQCVLGRAYVAAGDEREARKCYTAALLIEPDNVLAKQLLSVQSNLEAWSVN